MRYYKCLSPCYITWEFDEIHKITAESRVFCDKTLAFYVKESPKHWEEVSEAQWMIQEGLGLPDQWFVLYVDDRPNNDVKEYLNANYKVHANYKVNTKHKINYIREFTYYGVKKINGQLVHFSSDYINKFKGCLMLTVEEFNKLKENKMMNENDDKKLIGYRLIKPEYAKAVLAIEGGYAIGSAIADSQILKVSHDTAIRKLKDAGVLETWFIPVYNTIVKPIRNGDWVKDKNSSNPARQCYTATANTIQLRTVFGRADDHTYYDIKDYRLATKDEIKLAHEFKLPTINGYMGRIEEELVIYGNDCARIDIQMLKNMFSQNYKGNRTIYEIELNSGVRICSAQAKAIIAIYNKINPPF